MASVHHASEGWVTSNSLMHHLVQEVCFVRLAAPAPVAQMIGGPVHDVNSHAHQSQLLVSESRGEEEVRRLGLELVAAQTSLEPIMETGQHK